MYRISLKLQVIANLGFEPQSQQFLYVPTVTIKTAYVKETQLQKIFLYKIKPNNMYNKMYLKWTQNVNNKVSAFPNPTVSLAKENNHCFIIFNSPFREPEG